MRRFCSTAVAAVLSLGAATYTVIPAAARAAIDVGVSVGIAPPPLPIYAQPPIPGPDYLWTPGYWAWGGADYYWVPGAWVVAPNPGLLWTPAWWGWSDGVYLFHSGYWGPQVGFYGGVRYGFGYGGVGYQGGYWRGGHVFYNRTVNNFSGAHITNVYSRPVSAAGMSHASFNGPGGVMARPTAQQVAAEHQQHVGPTSAQTQQVQMASREPSLRAAVNHGAPPIAATARAGVLAGAGVVAASRAGGAYHPQAQVAAQTHRPGAARPQAETRVARNEPSHSEAARRSTEARAYHPPVMARAYHAPAYRGAAMAEAHAAPRAPAMAEFRGPPRGGGGAPRGGAPHEEGRHGPG